MPLRRKQAWRAMETTRSRKEKQSLERRKVKKEDIHQPTAEATSVRSVLFSAIFSPNGSLPNSLLTRNSGCANLEVTGSCTAKESRELSVAHKKHLTHTHISCGPVEAQTSKHQR
jgi:hypothetical protein